MGFFDSEKNVEEYIKMAEGHDGAFLIDHLKTRAPSGARVLELGMGPGKDLELLKAAGFDPVGSDYSQVFVERYEGDFPVHQLDARTLEIDEQFDVIYSNKVLHSLTEEELTQSFESQLRILKPGGLLIHSFWVGEGNETFKGMFAQYYKLESLQARLPDGLGVEDFQLYQEMEENDSFWVSVR